MMLLGAIVTIVVVMLTMAELGARFEKKQDLAPSVPAAALLVSASVPVTAAPAPATPSNDGSTKRTASSPDKAARSAAPRQSAQGDN
jgi:hypothetical protein